MSNRTAVAYPLSGGAVGFASPWIYMAGTGKLKFPDDRRQRTDQLKQEWAEAKEEGRNPYAEFEAAQKAAFEKSRAGKLNKLLSFGKKKEQATKNHYSQLDDSSSTLSGKSSLKA